MHNHGRSINFLAKVCGPKVLSFTFPFKLEAAGNNLRHWSATHKRNKFQDKAIKYFLNTQIFNLSEMVLPVKITLTRIAPREMDSDNLAYSFKHIRDIIADMLIPGQKAGFADSSKQLTWQYCQKRGKTREYAVEVCIKEFRENENILKE